MLFFGYLRIAVFYYTLETNVTIGMQILCSGMFQTSQTRRYRRED